MLFALILITLILACTDYDFAVVECLFPKNKIKHHGISKRLSAQKNLPERRY